MHGIKKKFIKMAIFIHLGDVWSFAIASAPLGSGQAWSSFVENWILYNISQNELVITMLSLKNT